MHFSVKDGTLTFVLLYLLCHLISHGPGLIGTFLNVLLYGIMVSQTWMYYTSYPR